MSNLMSRKKKKKKKINFRPVFLETEVLDNTACTDGPTSPELTEPEETPSNEYTFIRFLPHSWEKNSLVRHKQSGEIFVQKSEDCHYILPKRIRLLDDSISETLKFNPKHIVKLKTSFKSVERNKMNFIYEFMEHGSLYDLIQRCKKKNLRFSEPVLASIATRILEDLNYLHKVEKRIHRHLRPSSILIQENGDVKLDINPVDSLPKELQMDHLAEPHTYLYMSPERFKGDGHGCNSDIWSVGLVLAECALLKFPLPIDGSTWDIIQFLMKYVDGEEDLLDKQDASSFSIEFLDFIEKMMIFDKKTRPEAKTLLTHPFLKKSNDEEFMTWLGSLAIWRKLKGSKHQVEDLMERVVFLRGELEILKNSFSVVFLKPGSFVVHTSKVFFLK